MTITRIGSIDGEAIHEARLTSTAGVEVAVMTWGAAVRDWRVADSAGRMVPVTLGFDRVEDYPQHSRAFGIIAGRIANRVREGRFTLGGRTVELDRNEGANHLHGGRKGLGRKVWSLEADGSRARLTLTSPDGEMGYPGTVSFTVDITLEEHALTFHMTGVPDEPTPIALAQHSYYHLGGAVPEHSLMVAADRVTEVDDAKIPTGTLVPVEGTRLDFRTPRPVGREPVDMNFCLTARDPAAVLEGKDMRLVLATDRPGLQVFNAYNFTDIPVPGLGGRRYGRFAGLALEAQDWPDAVNHPAFGDVVATPDRPYRQTTTVTIAPRKD